MTAWRRLRDRPEAGVRPRLHEVLLTELRAAGLPAMGDAVIDGSHVRLRIRNEIRADLHLGSVFERILPGAGMTQD